MDNIAKYDLTRKYAVAFMRIFAQHINHSIADICNIVGFLKIKKQTLSEFSMLVSQKKNSDQLVTQFLEYVHLPNYFFSLVQLLIKHDRFNLFVGILEMIGVMIREQNNMQEIFIYSAYPLSTEHIEKIENFMLHLRKKSISHITCVVHSDLIAGIRIESNGFIWEHSVRKQLTTVNAILRQEGISYE